MILSRLTPPAVEVLTLDEIKSHLRVTNTLEDALILGYLAAARELCEVYVARSFITTGWRQSLDCFPGMYVDPRRPLQTYERASPGPLLAAYFPRASVLSVGPIAFIATDGTTTTLDPSLYDVQLGDEARVSPVYGHTWPATRFLPGAVTIDFAAGYGPTAADVPAVVLQAVRVMTSHLYDNRGDTDSDLPRTVRRLLAAANWGAYG